MGMCNIMILVCLCVPHYSVCVCCYKCITSVGVLEVAGPGYIRQHSQMALQQQLAVTWCVSVFATGQGHGPLPVLDLHHSLKPHDRTACPHEVH